MGMQAAEIAIEIVAKKATPKDFFIDFPEVKGLHINNDVAKKIGIKVPKNILLRDQITRQYEQAIDHFNAKEWRKAKNLLLEILKIDPQNKGATFHLNKVDAELIWIRKAVEEKEFQAQLKAIEADFNKGKYLTAITSCLKLQEKRPKDKKTATLLAKARKSLLPKTKEWEKMATKHYHSRNYKDAIQRFNKVLLVDPGHRQSKEYIRLAREKQKALENLEKNQ